MIALVRIKRRCHRKFSYKILHFRNNQQINPLFIQHKNKYRLYAPPAFDGKIAIQLEKKEINVEESEKKTEIYDAS